MYTVTLPRVRKQALLLKKLISDAIVGPEKHPLISMRWAWACSVAKFLRRALTFSEASYLYTAKNDHSDLGAYRGDTALFFFFFV